MGGDSLDDLRIEIDAKADSAKNTVNELIERLEVLKNGLKGFNDKRMGSAFDNLRQSTAGIKERLEPFAEFEKKLNGLGRNIKAADGMSELRKQIAQAETRLDSLLSKEDKMRTVGGIDENAKSFRNLQYDLSQVCGQLDTLYAKLEQIQEQKPLNFWEKPEWKEREAQSDSQEPQSLLEYAADNVRQSFSDMKEAVAPAADSVRHIGEEMRNVGTETDNARQKMEGMGNGGGLARFMEQLRSFSASDVFGRMSVAVRDFQTQLGTRIPTEQYTELAANIRQAETELQRLLDKQDRMEAQGVNTSSASWKGLQYDIRIAADRVAEFNRDMELLRASGGDSQHLGGLSYAFKGVANGAKSAFDALAGAMRKVNGAVKNLISKIAVVTKKTAVMTASLVKNHGMFGKFSSAIKKCGSVLGGLSKKLGSVVRLFTFMLLRRAITALFKDFGEAFQHLAQKSASVNKQISELISSCKYFSHQVAAMTKPLIDIFGPALIYIINLLSKAVGYINQFFSALTGKSYYTQAKKVAVDYAESLEGVAKKIKEVKDVLDIDELHIIRSNDDDSDSSGSNEDDLEDCYEELPINQKILDLVERLKKIFSELFEPMRMAWEDYGQGVIDAFNYALSSCKKLIVDMAKTWKAVWLNGSGYELCSNILLLLTSMLNWIGDIATAWDAAWQVKGYDYVQSVFDKLNTILSLIYTISESFRKAFNSGSGQEMIEHIYQIFTDLNYVVANLANGLKKAWQEAGTGDAIAQAIFDIINLILGSIEKITSSTREWAKNLNLSPLLTSIKNLLEKVKPLIEKIGDALSWAWENVLLPLGKWAVESAVPKVIDAISAAFEALDAILEVLKPIFKWIWDYMLEPLAKWTGGTIVEIIDGIATAFNGIGEVFKKISDGEDWGSIGKYIWEGLINGIKNVGSWIWEKLTDVFGGIVGFVKELLGIHSPSTVFAEIGSHIVNGLMLGISGAFPSLQGLMSNEFAGKIIEWFKSKLSINSSSKLFESFGQFTVQGYQNGISAMTSSLSSTILGLGSNILGWFRQKIDISTLVSSGKNLVQGLINGIGNMYSSLKSSVQTMANNVASWFTEKLKIHSPSRLFYSYGQFTVEGFNNAIDKMAGSTKKVVDDWAGSFGNMEAGVGFSVDYSSLDDYKVNDGSNFVASVTSEIQSTIDANNSSGNEFDYDTMGSVYKEAMREVLSQIIVPAIESVGSGNRNSGYGGNMSLLKAVQDEAAIYTKSTGLAPFPI